METSTSFGSVAVIDSQNQWVMREFTSDRRHNSVLFSPLQELLESKINSQIECVIVGSGPGSYSGTRVGIAAAQGVAIVANCPAVAVPSILAVPSAELGATCLAIGDARRGSFWTARMDQYDLACGPEIMDENEFQSIVAKAAAAGIPIFSFEESSRFPLATELRQQVRLEFPCAKRLWQAWKSTSQSTRDEWLNIPAQPMYLKPPHITPAKRPWLITTPT